MKQQKKNPATSKVETATAQKSGLSVLLQSSRVQWLWVLLVFLLYGNTIRNEYSLDDSIDIYENVHVMKGFSGIPGILTSPFVTHDNYQFDYRPFSPITFAIEKEIFGFNPHVSHFFNVVLYAICVLLLGRFLQKVTAGKYPVAIAVSILFFIVHPLHTEVVASLKNRQELLSFICGFGALHMLLQYLDQQENKPEKLVYSLLLFAGALFAKLSSLPFLFFIGIILFFYPNRFALYKKAGLTFLYLIIPVIFIFAIREWLFRPFYFDENPLVEFNSISYKLGTTMQVFLTYLKLMFFPYPMAFYYGYGAVPVVEATAPVALLGYVVFGVLLYYSIAAFRRRKMEACFGLFFLASLAMYNNLTFTYPGLMSDRAMFLPSAWFIPMLIVGGQQWLKEKNIAIQQYRFPMWLVAAVLFVVAGMYTVRRNAAWKTQLSIMEADIAHLSAATLPNYYYAWTLDSELRKGQSEYDQHYLLQTAKQHYVRSLELGIKMAEPYYRLAMLYKYFQSRQDSAVFYLKEYVKYDTTHSKGFYELGDAYFQQGNFVEALPAYRRAFAVNRQDTMSLFYAVQSLYLSQGADPALRLNDTLYAFAPRSEYPHLNYGTIYKMSGQTAKGYAYLDSAVQYGCKNVQLWQDLQLYYISVDNQEKSAYYARLLRQ